MKAILSTLFLTIILASAKTPDIVFIFADDWGRHASAYAAVDGPGTPADVVKTPNFDRIASQGSLFEQAFVSSPSCTPCRSALVSGKHFWQTGSASILHSKWDFSQPSFPLILQKNGFRIGRTGKAWGPGGPSEAPYGGKAATYQSGGGKFNNFSQNVTDAVASGKSIPEAKQALYDEVGENLDSFLESRTGERPFFYHFGSTNTHRKWIKGSGKALWNIDPDSLREKLPPFLPDVEEIRQDFADYLGEVQAFDHATGIILDRLEKDGLLEDCIVIISGDHGAPGFPHGKVNLYDFGTRVPLAVRIGKNVMPPASKPPGRVARLTSLIDLAPTILEATGIPVPGEMTRTSLMSVLTGKQSAISADEAVFTGRERHVPTARENNLPYPQRAIRTKDHLFIINFEPDRWPAGDPRKISKDSIPSVDDLENNTHITLADEDAGPTKAWMVQHRDDYSWKEYYDRAYGKRPKYELYDLKKDPHQMENLAGKKEHEETKAALESRLMEELTRTDDPRVTGDRQFFETAPMTDAK